MTQVLPQSAKTVTANNRGLSHGTEVLTLEGIRPVQALRTGDRIITRRGACALLRLNRTAPNRYALGFDRPQIVLLSTGQAHSESGLPFAA